MSAAAQTSNHSHLSSGPSFDHIELEWPVSRKDYVLGDMIGSGATAVVFEATCTPLDNRSCAIKRINLDRQNVNITELSNEIKLMSLCNHRNIVTYYTSFVHKHELWVVMRLLTKGSALDIIKHFEKLERNSDPNGKKEPPLPEYFIIYLLHEVLQGLDYLHKQGNIHRDVKAGNILIGDNGEVQLADFGVSAWISASNKRSQGGVRHTFVGTPCWMAPEIIEQDSAGYDWKVDIWSFGITAIELATGKAPYAKYPAMKVMIMTVQNDSPRLEQCCHEANVSFSSLKKCKLDHFISECLQKDPLKRPTAAKLLKHEIFKKFQHSHSAFENVVGLTHNGKETKFIDFVEKLPHFKHRAQKVKRVPGSTGTMHRTEDGGWEWSDDELDTGSSLNAVDQSHRDNNKSSQSDRKNRLLQADQFALPSGSLQSSGDADYSANTSSPELSHQNGSDRQTLNASSTSIEPEIRTVQPRKFELCLRMRNESNELNDIKFPFNSAEDSADSVSQEMVSAGLISGSNKILLAHNIVKIIEGRERKVMFKLNLPADSREVPNADTFCGFAMLTLID